MPRPVAQHSEPINSDSFLDIVASVVSIMIIMVVMEGSRIKNAPVKVSIPANPAVAALEKDLAAEQALRGDVLKSAEEIGNLERETVRRGTQRDVLATMVSAVEHKIQERRQKLDAAKRADFDLARNLSESRFQLEQLVEQREQVENAPAPPVVVESYPTPISRAVDGPEAHFLVSNGRVVFDSHRAALGAVSIASQAAGLQASRSAGVDRDGRAGGRFSPSLHAGASRHFARDGKAAAAAATRGCKNGRSSRPRTIWASRCGWPWSRAPISARR